MDFKININFNIDKSHTVKNGTRTAILNHERRKHGFTANGSIDKSLSHYNSYNDLFSYKDAMRATLMPYIKHHNNLKSVKLNPKRKIKSVKQLLDSRGKRIPYKYLVIKFGNGETRKKLLQLFKNRGYGYSDYAMAINKTFLKYAQHDNKNYNHIKFDHVDTNLDEVRRHGGDHGHLGALGIATTKNGKTSLSFDRATKQQYGGKTNISSWHIMQQKEAHTFLDIATPIFQRYLTPNFSFQLSRNPSNNNGLEHNAYVRTQEINDKLRDSNQQLSQLLSSASKSITKLKAEVKKLRPLVIPENLISENNKLGNSLIKQNDSLKSQLIKLKSKYDQAKQALEEAKVYNNEYQEMNLNLDYANRRWRQTFSHLRNENQRISKASNSQNLSQNLKSLSSTLKNNQAKLKKIETLAYSQPLSKKWKELPNGFKHVLRIYTIGLTRKKLNIDKSNKNVNSKN